MLPILDAQLKSVQAAIDNMVKAIEQGVFTRSTKARLEELETEETKLKQSIREEIAKQPTITKEMILFVLRRFRDMDMKVQKNREQLIDTLIKSIIVYDDRFEIFVTYQDEPITVPTTEEIDEMKASSPVEALTSPKKIIPLWDGLF